MTGDELKALKARNEKLARWFKKHSTSYKGYEGCARCRGEDPCIEGAWVAKVAKVQEWLKENPGAAPEAFAAFYTEAGLEPPKVGEGVFRRAPRTPEEAAEAFARLRRAYAPLDDDDDPLDVPKEPSGRLTIDGRTVPTLECRPQGNSERKAEGPTVALLADRRRGGSAPSTWHHETGGEDEEEIGDSVDFAAWAGEHFGEEERAAHLRSAPFFVGILVAGRRGQTKVAHPRGRGGRMRYDEGRYDAALAERGKTRRDAQRRLTELVAAHAVARRLEAR